LHFIFLYIIMQLMARASYKIKEAKKDKTLSFRIPNQLFNLIKKLSQNERTGINIYARNKLIEYIYSKYPESEEDLNILHKEELELGKKKSEIFDEMDRLGKEMIIHDDRIKEINRHLANLNKTRVDINNRLIFIDIRIRQLEEGRGK